MGSRGVLSQNYTAFRIQIASKGDSMFKSGYKLVSLKSLLATAVANRCWVKKLSMVAVVLGLAAFPSQSRGDFIALQLAASSPGVPTGGTYQAASINLTIGWTFSVASPITVTELGAFSSTLHPLTSAVVGIYSGTGSSATLKTSTTVTFANSTPMPSSSLFRFTAITPVTLSAGTYTIAEYAPSGTEYYTHVMSGITLGSGVTYLSSDAYGPTPQITGLSNPYNPGVTGTGYDDETSGPQVEGRFGPDFAYATPEPATFVLFSMGLVGLGGYSWLRRKQTGDGIGFVLLPANAKGNHRCPRRWVPS